MIGVNSKVFCSTCGNLLNFQFDSHNSLTCALCLQPNNQCLTTNDTIKNTNKSTSRYNNSATWKNKLYNEIDKFKINVGVGNKVIIVQDCPNKSCDSKEMLEYAMQLRSVDEGSTVFSECPKCGIKFTMYKAKSLDTYMQTLNTEYSSFSLESYLDKECNSLSKQSFRDLLKKIIKLMTINEDNYFKICDNYLNETNIIFIFEYYLAMMEEERHKAVNIARTTALMYATLKSFKKIREKLSKNSSNLLRVLDKECFYEFLFGLLKTNLPKDEASSKEASDYCFDVKLLLKLLEFNKYQSSYYKENLPFLNKVVSKLSYLSEVSDQVGLANISSSSNMTVKKINNNSNSTKTHKEYKELSAGRIYNLRIHKGKLDSEIKDSLDERTSSSKSVRLLAKRSRNTRSSKSMGLSGIDSIGSQEGSSERNGLSSIAVDLFQAKKNKKTPDIHKELRSTIDHVNRLLKKSNSTDSLKLKESIKQSSQTTKLCNSEKKSNQVNLTEYLNIKVNVNSESIIKNTTNSSVTLPLKGILKGSSNVGLKAEDNKKNRIKKRRVYFDNDMYFWDFDHNLSPLECKVKEHLEKLPDKSLDSNKSNSERMEVLILQSYKPLFDLNSS